MSGQENMNVILGFVIILTPKEFSLSVVSRTPNHQMKSKLKNHILVSHLYEEEKNLVSNFVQYNQH